MPDRPPHTLVHRAHTRVLVELARRRLPIRTARVLLGRDVRQLGFPLCGVRVGEGEPDDDDAAAERVAEVDAFGERAADDGEEERAPAGAGGDGGAVGG